MRLAVAGFFIACSCLPSSGCQPKSVPTTQAIQDEFERLLTKSLRPPEEGIDWVSWDLDDSDYRMLELACTSAIYFDRLLDRMPGIPAPSFPGQFFWYGHKHMKDCPLGEDYVRILADRDEGHPPTAVKGRTGTSRSRRPRSTSSRRRRPRNSPRINSRWA